jgi:hypothetical protein
MSEQSTNPQEQDWQRRAKKRALSFFMGGRFSRNRPVL